MKILLTAVNSKYIHSNLAVYSLKAYHDAHSDRKDTVELAEYTINQLQEEIIKDIYKKQPDVLAFSCYIWNIEMIHRMICELKKILPDTDIWLGGPEVSYDAKEVLKNHPQIKGVMIGEGEQTFCELAACYENFDENCEKELLKVRQICFRSQTGEIVATPYRELMNMDELPFVYQDMRVFEHKIIYYESSRGCPFGCSYCLSSVSRSVRFRSLPLVFAELQIFLDAKVPQVKFVDRTFNCNHERTLALLHFLRTHDNGVTNFHFEVAADLLNEAELAEIAAMREGLVQLEIGVQSTNLQTIEAIDRTMNLEKLKKVVASVHSAGNVHQHLDLIAGLPYENLERFEQSFNDVYNMQPDQLQLGFLKVLKGSKMYQNAKEYGIVYTDTAPYEVLYTKWISYADVLTLKAVEEMVELYYNSNQFTHLIPVLQSRFENPFAMYDKLADFYHEKGYFVHTPARAYRYQVLLEFAQQEDPDGMELYRELAVYDLYLRENAKSRPAFALDEKPYHDQIVEFYQEEEKNRTYLPGYEEYHAKQLQRMTHLEVFSWPVQKKAWELISMLKRGEVPETKTAILFDYQNRDRLTDNARTAVVELPTAADAKPTAGQATVADAEAVTATGKGAAD